MRRAFISAVGALSIATAANAGELSDIKAKSEQLREQNQALTKRIAELEKRQRKLEAHSAEQPAVAERPENSMYPMAADYITYKAEYKKALPLDDSLTWHGVTLYGLVDVGLTYQNHGAPLNNTTGVGLNYLVAKNNNGSYFGVGPNALSSSFVGVKGNQEISDGLSAGLGSIVQNNGLAIGAQNTFADSAKDGQAFNMAAYAGLRSPIYGTLTYGRQNALTSDGVVAYDPMSSSNAFSLIGFQGATGGAGDTENRILDNSFKYAASLGPVRAAVETQLSGGGNSAPRNVVQGQIGGDCMGLSLDVFFSYRRGE